MPQMPCAKQEGPWHAVWVTWLSSLAFDELSDYKHKHAWKALTKGHGHNRSTILGIFFPLFLSWIFHPVLAGKTTQTT